jgi:shikimate dehydrogenase
MPNELQVFALFGNPVGHSLSPLMHNAALTRMGIAGTYVPLCIRDLPAAVTGLRGMRIRGVSVTVPFKETVIEHLDEIDGDAGRIGAVNTITNDDGFLRGMNTDWLGITAVLREAMEIRGKRFVILGAGGTARAALFAVLAEGGRPFIVNRTLERARRLADEWRCHFCGLEDIGRVQADCLINTTSVGMAPHAGESPVPAKIIGRFPWVMDVVYTPLKTRLLQEAERAGSVPLSGLGMFVAQGAEQLRRWTGQEPPYDYMFQVVREQLTTGVAGPVGGGS